MPDTGCPMWDMGCGMPDIRCWKLDVIPKGSMQLYAIAVSASTKIPPMRDDKWKEIGYWMWDVGYGIWDGYVN